MKFISIDNLLAFIADNIRIKKEEVLKYLNLEEIPEQKKFFNIERSNFGVLGRQAFEKIVFAQIRYSEAAVKIEAAFHNAKNQNIGPVWYETMHTGEPRISDEARDRVLAVLATAAYYPKILQDTLVSCDFDPLISFKEAQGKFELFSMTSLQGIGFEEDDLIFCLKNLDAFRSLPLPDNFTLIPAADESKDAEVLQNLNAITSRVIHSERHTYEAWLETFFDESYTIFGKVNKATSDRITNRVWTLLIEKVESDDPPISVKGGMQNGAFFETGRKAGIDKEVVRKRVVRLLEKTQEQHPEAHSGPALSS